MKFVNFTNASRPRPAGSHSPYGRKEEKAAPPAPLPPPRNVNQDLKNLLKAMKPEPKALLESRMLKASRVASNESIKAEAEDILSILRNLHTK